VAPRLIFSSDLFTSQGQQYNISAIVNDKFELDLAKYEEQGPIHLSMFFALSYGFGLVHHPLDIIRVNHPLALTGCDGDRWFLNTLLPLHSAISSACPTSTLPIEAKTSSEGSSLPIRILMVVVTVLLFASMVFIYVEMSIFLNFDKDFVCFSSLGLSVSFC
jgi:hypothetical protein